MVLLKVGSFGFLALAVWWNDVCVTHNLFVKWRDQVSSPSFFCVNFFHDVISGWLGINESVILFRTIVIMPSILGTTTTLRSNRNRVDQKAPTKYGRNRRGHRERTNLSLIEEEPNVKRMMLYIGVIVCCGVILLYKRSKSMVDGPNDEL
jgi:hypothetical protein